MQFLKKHYEKIILSVVLLALGASAVWLSTAISDARSVPGAPEANPRVKPSNGQWTNTDLSPLQSALKDMKVVPPLKLTVEHNLFNPVIWKLKPDGTLFKMTLGGPAAVSILDIRPYYYTITLEDQSGSGWYLSAQHAKGPKGARLFYNLNPKEKLKGDKPLAVIAATGTNAGQVPTLQLKLKDTDEVVSVSMGKPYKQIEGYDADLEYHGSDEKKKIPNVGVGSSFTLSGESYKMFALTNDSLTLQDTRTQKKTTISFTGQH